MRSGPIESEIWAVPWKGDNGFLAPGAVRPAGDALVTLIEQSFPITQYIEDPAEWWSVSGPALVARASRTLQSTLVLYDARCDLDAATLVRSIFEQLLRFAWLAHDPTERLMTFESSDLRGSERIASGVRALGHDMDNTDAWEVALLGPRPQHREPSVQELARLADREWPEAPRLFFMNVAEPFGLLYETVYRAASRAVHGSAYVTGPFVDASRQPTVVVRAAERPSGDIGYEMAVWSVAIMLAIASDALGWPSRSAVIAAMHPHVPST